MKHFSGRTSFRQFTAPFGNFPSRYEIPLTPLLTINNARSESLILREILTAIADIDPASRTDGHT